MAEKQAPKSTSKYLTSNKARGVTRHRALAHGPAKHGKTFSALMASKKFPKKLPNTKWLKLDDLLWVPFDDDALAGALEQKLDVPSIDVDQLLMDNGDILGVMKTIADLCYEEAEKNSNLVVVVDTITKLDKILNRWWNEEENAPKGKGGNIDGFAVYRCIQESHMRFHDDLCGLPCHLIFLAHSKPVGESASVKAKAKAGGLPSETPIDTVMDFNYYASGNIYRQDTSIIASIHAERDAHSGGMKRWAYTESHLGFEGGCRFQLSLDPKEEADFGQMFGKIEKQLA